MLKNLKNHKLLVGVFVAGVLVVGCLTLIGSQSARAITLAEQLKGKILLQVDRNGEAWYVQPSTATRFFLGRPTNAFSVMSGRGLGISNADLEKIPVAGSSATGDSALRNRLSGYILLQVEKNGEGWYVNPGDKKRYALGRPTNAFSVMKRLGLGITSSNLDQIPKDANSQSDTPVTWSFNVDQWKPNGIPPTCVNPFIVRLPFDINTATSLLYPGQYRGGLHYKPHGGFRLDGTAYNTVTITAPFTGYVVEGSRHYENGEVQYYFDVVHPCGIRYRLDHLHTLSPTMQALADQLPPPSDSSQSYPLKPKLIKVGAVIATAVGHSYNVGFDLGVYDLRQRNAAAQSAAYREAHADMVGNAYYAVCWFDWLSASDEAAVRALPPGDGVSGASSDYCL